MRRGRPLRPDPHGAKRAVRVKVSPVLSFVSVAGWDGMQTAALARLGGFLHPHHAVYVMNPVTLYEQVRWAEGRIYPDDIVARLPYMPPSHIHAGEWQLRARSSAWLQRYLEQKTGPLHKLAAMVIKIALKRFKNCF